MSESSFDKIRLAELIAKELDGSLTDKEFADLESMLNRDSEAVDFAS